MFTSPDGWSFAPHEMAALPFASGSQSIVYYDDQRQLYVGHHRSDYGETPGGHTRRRFVLSETKDLLGPWPWERITPERTAEVAKHEPIQSDKLDPWFLDNGPLTPSGLGIELPTVFGPDDQLDPVGTDIYTTEGREVSLGAGHLSRVPGGLFSLRRRRPGSAPDPWRDQDARAARASRRCNSPSAATV